MGGRDHRELESRLTDRFHLLKWQAQPARGASWRKTLRTQRRRSESAEQSPSLRREVPG